MTRRSRRSLERAVEDLAGEVDAEEQERRNDLDRLTDEQVEAILQRLDEMFQYPEVPGPGEDES